MGYILSLTWVQLFTQEPFRREQGVYLSIEGFSPPIQPCSSQRDARKFISMRQYLS